MKWLLSHKKQGILILVVLVLAGVLVASFLTIGTDSRLGKAAESVVEVIQKPVTGAGNAIRSALYRITHAKELEEENEALAAKVDELEKQLADAALSKEAAKELSELRDFLNDNSLADYEIVTTRVTALDRSNWFSAITVGAGTRDGVSVNDVVVSSKGLVGRVISVGPNYAKVLCAIHDAQNVSFKVIRNLDALGIVSGDGEGNLAGYLLSTEALVKTGDKLITSGMELYPEGILIGTVTDRRQDEDTHIIYIKAEPAVDFATIEAVSVILLGGEGAAK